MLHGWRKDRYVRKPILGFGRAGIAASVVFCVLLIAHLAGFDFQYTLLFAVHRCLGPDAVYYVVGSMPWYFFSLTNPVFGPAEVLLVVVAFRIVPIRLGWWRYALVIGMGLAMPMAAKHLISFFYRNNNFDLEAVIPSGFVAGPLSIVMAQGAVGVVVAVALWLATRSKLVLAAFLSSVMVTFERHWLEGLGSINAGPYYGLNVPHTLSVILVAGSTWTWAIRMRVNWPSETACDSCGYDLRGLRDSVCPECGTEHGKQPAETPLTSP